jgi:HEPN domain-containing protein
LNRDDFRELARIRLKEAKVLLDNGCHEGAYYLCGYTVECGLKACVAKLTKRYDFPDKNFAQEVFTHDLVRLVKAANLATELSNEAKANPQFELYWNLVKDWRETSRYDQNTRQQAVSLYEAITDKRYGVLRWLRRHW